MFDRQKITNYLQQKKSEFLSKQNDEKTDENLEENNQNNSQEKNG